MIRVAGADVAGGKWVAVVLEDGRFAGALVSPTLEQLYDALGPVATIAVDIPIGLPADGRDYPRPADTEARRFISPRHSSVFSAPARPVLDAKTYQEANRLHKELTGKGISQQSWALKAKILEAEALCSQHSNIIEVHPEVSFRAMNDAPLEFSKKQWNGQSERRSLLDRHGIHIPDNLPEQAGHVPPDDILDAAAAAWTAQRFAAGQSRSLPAQPVEGSGVIWY